MSTTVDILNNLTMSSQGRTVAAKQGAAANDAADVVSITVDGVIHDMIGSLATATVVTVWDDDNDKPADWDYLFFWADVDMYIQIIGSTTNVIFKVLAKVPFTLTYDSMLAAADTTIITGGTEPTLTDIDSVVIGNYSGGTGNYVFAVFD